MINSWPSVVQRARKVVQRARPLVQHATSSSVPRARQLAQHALSLAQRARLLLAERTRSLVQQARALMPRPRLSTQLLGEVALGGLLLATLAFAPRDAVPAEDGTVWPPPGVRLQAAAAEQPLFGLALPGLSQLTAVARAGGALVGASASAKASIPTSPPVQLLIPTLNVHRAIEGVGTNRLGVMNLPVNGWNAGWYQRGPIPGAPGDAVIEGHAGYPDQPMIFGKLATLKAGAQVVVVLGDGTRRLFEVVSMATLNPGVAPAGFAEPYGSPRLTLITCTGHFDADNKYYSKRLAVELRYVGLV